MSSGIAYLDSGAGEPVLICLHGIQGSKESYKHWLNSGLSRQARLIIPDIPGFGDSQAPAEDGFELDRQAERLIAFLDTIGVGPLVVYGHSLGGMLATLLLDKIPNRVIGAISSEGNLRLEDCGESRRVAAMTFDEFKTSRYPELQARGIRTSALGFYATARSVVQVSESERLLRLLTASTRPVLFLRGGASHFVTVPAGSHVRNVEIPNETHFTLSESPATGDVIAGFLRELRR